MPESVTEESSPDPMDRRSLGPKCRAMMRQEACIAKGKQPVSRKQSVINSVNINKQLKEVRSKKLLSSVRTKKLSKDTEITDSDTHYIPETFGDTERMDIRRQWLMSLTRRAGPLTIFFDVHHIRHTALPSVFCSLNFMLLVVSYAGSAVTTRLGYWPVPPDASSPVDDDLTSLVGMELLVTFSLVFYFGYCYNRFWEQYALAMSCKGAIINNIVLAKSTSMGKNDIYDLWRYLNLAQLAGYVALSPVYTRGNLFDDFARMHNLLPAGGDTNAEVKRIEYHKLAGGRGAQVYNEYCLYALELLRHAKERNELPSMTHLLLQEQIIRFRDSMTGLFNLHYTVIPFAYIHLVSFLVNFYLITFALAKGRLFTPDADLARGVIFPCLATFFLSVSCLGLIEIGGRMQNPVGNDAEDFAVLTFLNLTLDMSKQAMRTPESARNMRHNKWRAANGHPAHGTSSASASTVSFSSMPFASIDEALSQSSSSRSNNTHLGSLQV